MTEPTGDVLPLREWRVRKYWSFARLAKEARVSTETLQRAEKGGRLHDITQRKIADALGIRVAQVEEFASEEEGRQGDQDSGEAGKGNGKGRKK